MIVYQSTHAQRTSFQDLCWVLKVSGSMILRACMWSHFSCVRLFMTLWTVAHQAPLSMGISRQECWSGLDISFSRDLPDPGTEPVSCVSCTDKQILYHCAIWKAQTRLEDPQSSPEANGTRIPGLPTKTEKIGSIFFNTSPECPVCPLDPTHGPPYFASGTLDGWDGPLREYNISGRDSQR